MLESRTILNPNQLPFHQLHNILLDLLIVGLYLLYHRVVTVFVEEAADFGDRLVGGSFMLYGIVVYHNLRMEDFLVDGFAEVIRYYATNIPCESILILLVGIRLSNCVLIEAEVLLRFDAHGHTEI